MSSAGKASKSASKFSLSDLQDYASSRSVKKDLASCSRAPPSKTVTTRGKGSKKRKADDTLDELSVFQDQIGDFVSEKLGELQMHIVRRVDAVEQEKAGIQRTAMAKDKKISSLEQEIRLLKREMELAEDSAKKSVEDILEGAKHSAVVAFLKIKLQMAEEAENPDFDRTAWDKEMWKLRLAELEEEEDDVVKTPRPDIGFSGVKFGEEKKDVGEGGDEKEVEEKKKEVAVE